VGGHEERKGEKIHASKLLLEILKYGYYLEDLGLDCRIILK
jgi:hypothetical protein